MKNYLDTVRLADLIWLEVIKEITDEERVELDNMTGSRAQTMLLIKDILKTDPKVRHETVSDAVADQVWQSIGQSISSVKNERAIKLKRMVIYGSLAAAVVAIAIIVFAPMFSTDQQQFADVMSTEKQSVTLIMDTGDTINLEEVAQAETMLQLAENKTSQSPVEQFNTLIVPVGKTYTLTLSDSSQVIVASNSTLRFPTTFTGSTRSVELVGEGYFMVTKDASKPFIVTSDGYSTTVLGTEFCMRRYADESCVTTLVSGYVSVADAQGNKADLNPGQQAVMNGANIDVKSVDTSCFTSWIDGHFMFRSRPLKDIIKDIALWYNMEYRFENPNKEVLMVTARLKIYPEIGGVLGVLGNMKNFKIEIEGNCIVVR